MLRVIDEKTPNLQLADFTSTGCGYACFIIIFQSRFLSKPEGGGGSPAHTTQEAFGKTSSRRSPRCRGNQLWTSFEGVCYLITLV